MNKAAIVISAFFIFTSLTGWSQEATYTKNELEYKQVFKDFEKYLATCINDRSDITDFTHLSFMLHHFLFINNKKSKGDNDLSPDSISVEQVTYLKKSIKTFYQFLQENQSRKLGQNLMAIPARLYKNKDIYNQLSKFQKENTMVFVDKRQPSKVLGYMLFIPFIKDINYSSRIWSWNLEFKFGKFLYISFLGEEGYEYMFNLN